MNEPKLNKALIQKMIKRIQAKPESYDQGTPGQSYKSRVEEGLYDDDETSCRSRPAPECGSVECLMGQAIIANAKTQAEGIKQMYQELNNGNIKRTAHDLTGLPYSLFGATSSTWPEPFASQWIDAKTYKGQARAAINLLKAILKTNGKVLEQ